MMYFESGGAQTSLTTQQLREGLHSALEKYSPAGKTRKALALPPDITRLHSRAGQLTIAARDYYGSALTDVMPALGTHYPMAGEEIDEMFPGLDHGLVRPHRWRDDLVTLGRVPAEFLREVSGGIVDYDWPAQVNKLLVEGDFDCILSIGQVVPHEVIGFANHNKNIFVGTGGSEGIHKSHFLGAAYGMEKIMGRPLSPVRQVLNYASDHFATDLPVLYVLTVVGSDENGKLHTRGLFIGDGYECYNKAAELSAVVNFTMMDEPIQKAVVYLDPKEFRSTWLGNKSIYRTRMAMADGGDLYVLAPGLKEFGEDKEIDRLIRRYGYHGTPKTLEAVETHSELSDNLSAAAHLIHGSSEGRFNVHYAAGNLTREEITSAGYNYAELSDLCGDLELDMDNLGNTNTGNRTDKHGNNYYFIQNPALGLWAHESRLKENS